MSNTEIQKVILEARSGVALFAAQFDALAHAATERVDVDLIHNERVYTVRFNDLADQIKLQEQ